MPRQSECLIASRLREKSTSAHVLIEDVVASGGQLIESAKALRALGAVVLDALCVIDREAGGPALLADAGITLHSLFRMTELKDAAG